MTDYTQLKVPDLKKLLQERSLTISGNKADLIARLQENDGKKPEAAASAEDEINWDEEPEPTTEPAKAAVTAGGKGAVANPTVVPNQAVDVDPATTTDLKVTGGEDVPVAADGVIASSGTTVDKVVEAEPEAPKQDFSIGIGKSDAEKEAEKRAARAKRFGITEDEEAKKLAERAKKFGVENKADEIKGLDDALPERRAKRERDDKQGGRAAKRQTPDRRTEPAKSKAVAAKSAVPAVPAKKPLTKITDDPAEKAKAEARAKRFQQAA